jgi:hypothetical protein
MILAASPAPRWSYGILNFFSRKPIADDSESFPMPSHPQSLAKSVVRFANHLSVTSPAGDSPGFPTRKISMMPHRTHELAANA